MEEKFSEEDITSACALLDAVLADINNYLICNPSADHTFAKPEKLGQIACFVNSAYFNGNKGKKELAYEPAIKVAAESLYYFDNERGTSVKVETSSKPKELPHNVDEGITKIVEKIINYNDPPKGGIPKNVGKSNNYNLTKEELDFLLKQDRSKALEVLGIADVFAENAENSVEK